MTHAPAFFSWENIGELAHLEEHLEFARLLIDKYRWEEDVRKEFQARMDVLRKKQGDRQLNISVIGEFSSGKSTFINALLRMNLLESGSLQGTTVAATLIEYGEEYRLSVQWQDGRGEVFLFPDLLALRKKLNELAAWNEEARALSVLRVSLPSPTLQNNRLRIIDTPGLDANTPWHQQVTIRTLQEYSDLSLILVDAVRPLPDSLCSFIQQKMASILEQCAFVITKVDMIPPRELKAMQKFVEKTAAARFSLAAPLVLSYASLDVLRTVAPDEFDPGKYPQDPALSIENEGKLMAHSARQRAAAQAKKLLSLMDGIYAAMSGRMGDLRAELEDRLLVLKNTQQMDLTDFVAKQKRLQAQFYEIGVAAYREKVAEAGRQQDLIEAAQQAILERIENQGSTDRLNEYMHEQIAGDCKQEAEKICRAFQEYAGEKNPPAQAFRRRIDDFQRAFRLYFRDLKCLQPDQIRVDAILPEIEMPKIREIDLAGVYTKDMVKKENRWAGGGAAAGAAIGTAVAPGVGTIIGAAVGFVGGLFGADKAGVNIAEMKKNTRLKLEEPLIRYFTEVQENVISQLAAYTDGVGKRIDTEIDRYLEAYQHTVDGWIEEEKIRQYEMEKEIDAVEADRRRIDTRRESLENMRRMIRPEKEE